MLLTPGAVVACRNRLWRVDGYADDVLTATTIDGGPTEQHRLYVPFDDVIYKGVTGKMFSNRIFLCFVAGI